MPPRTADVDTPEVLARVTEGLAWVDALARRLRREFGNAATVEELVSCGREGLLLAARTFDDSRGVPFRSCATLEARGSMIDGIRSTGQLPRRMYRQLRALEAAQNVELSLAEETTAAEKMRGGGVGGPVDAAAADARLTDCLATAATAMAMGMLSAPVPIEDRVDLATSDRSPEEELERSELLARIRTAIDNLPEQERRLVERHYFGDVTIDEAAREQGLSKSWGSRLHARAVEAIAKELKRNRAF